MPNSSAQGPFSTGSPSFHAYHTTGIAGSLVPIRGCVRGQLEVILRQPGKPTSWFREKSSSTKDLEMFTMSEDCTSPSQGKSQKWSSGKTKACLHDFAMRLEIIQYSCFCNGVEKLAS
ncbi:hypothetical protein GRJ2_001582200 [Grus japonensis]|uniref:Uncharacterized protein n=1 Tax=Grus japonensis TaxID=30415 RepID=A0ABC9X2B8_GRUJA